jgi:CCR4-NOT transcription complex subunit 10
MGITLLFNKQPVNAFECLYKLTDVYNHNPRLWLRLAECCIMCYRHLTPEASNNSQKTKEDGEKSTTQTETTNK